MLAGRPKLWQNANLSPMAGATISPLCARRTSKNCGETQILHLPKQPFLHACRTSKTVAKRKFLTCFCNPFVTSCWSDVHNCGNMVILYAARCCISETRVLILLDEASCRIRLVRNCSEMEISYIFAHAAVAKRSFRNF